MVGWWHHSGASDGCRSFLTMLPSKGGRLRKRGYHTNKYRSTALRHGSSDLICTHIYIYLPLPAVGYCTKQSRWVISTYCTSPHFDRSTPRSKVVKFHLSSRHLKIHIGTSEQSRLLLSEMTICHSSPSACCNSRCCANSELKKK